MPTYTSKCLECNATYEYIRKVDQRNSTPLCCDTPTIRTLDTPMIGAMSFVGHSGVMLPTADNNGAGTWLEDGSAYKKFIREKKYMVGDEGPQEAAIQRRNMKEAEAKKRRETVERVVGQAL